MVNKTTYKKIVLCGKDGTPRYINSYAGRKDDDIIKKYSPYLQAIYTIRILTNTTKEDYGKKRTEIVKERHFKFERVKNENIRRVRI